MLVQKYYMYFKTCIQKTKGHNPTETGTSRQSFTSCRTTLFVLLCARVWSKSIHLCWRSWAHKIFSYVRNGRTDTRTDQSKSISSTHNVGGHKNFKETKRRYCICWNFWNRNGNFIQFCVNYFVSIFRFKKKHKWKTWKRTHLRFCISGLRSNVTTV